MDSLNGYEYSGEWNIASNGQWLIGTRKGTRYFIKKFNTPKFPKKGMVSPKVEARMKDACNAWEGNQRTIIKTLSAYAKPTGNLVVPVELFRVDTSFYKVTYAVDMSSLSVKQISALPEKDKILMLRTMTHSIRTLHKAKIVHGDLKPDNILVTKGPSGNYVTKVTDFDDSYFERMPPTAEETVGTPNYYSPELAEYISEGDEELGKMITCKSDIFALGLIFHEYLTGCFPNHEGYIYPYMKVLDGNLLPPKENIPANLRILLTRMLDPEPDKRPTIDEVFSELELSKAAAAPAPKPTASPVPGAKPVAPGTYIEKHRNGQYTIHEGAKKCTVPEIYIKSYLKLHPDVKILGK